MWEVGSTYNKKSNRMNSIPLITRTDHCNFLMIVLLAILSFILILSDVYTGREKECVHSLCDINSRKYGHIDFSPS